jgi:hypothetical protein
MSLQGCRKIHRYLTTLAGGFFLATSLGTSGVMAGSEPRLVYRPTVVVRGRVEGGPSRPVRVFLVENVASWGESGTWRGLVAATLTDATGLFTIGPIPEVVLDSSCGIVLVGPQGGIQRVPLPQRRPGDAWVTVHVPWPLLEEP